MRRETKKIRTVFITNIHSSYYSYSCLKNWFMYLICKRNHIGLDTKKDVKKAQVFNKFYLQYQIHLLFFYNRICFSCPILFSKVPPFGLATLDCLFNVFIAHHS